MNHRKPQRSYYLLPNAITTANLFAGFYAIMQAINGRFEVAATAIFIAMLMDGMDGRVARLTNTQSSFGEQYDSMADMVSFGVAPAIVIYNYALGDLGRLGWVAAFVYVAGAALRLARFNTNIAVVDSRFFQGLPSPSAAALLAGFVWMSSKHIFGEDLHAVIAFCITVFAGVSMISNAPYFSGKSLLKKEKPASHKMFFILVVIFALIMLNPPVTITVLVCLYAISGWVYYYKRIKVVRTMLIHKKGQAPNEPVPPSEDE